MEEVKKINGIFIAKVHSLYNCKTEVYKKQLDQNVRPCKNERSISVVCYRKKISYRIFCKKVIRTYLKLNIQDFNEIIKVDITKFIENEYSGKEINKKTLSVLKTKISKEILVQFIAGAWKIIDYDNILIK